MYKRSLEVHFVRPLLAIGAMVAARQNRGILLDEKPAAWRWPGLFLLALLFAPLPIWAAASVTLAWNPIANPNIAGYNIYYGGASHAYTNKMSVGLATNVTISGLVEGNTYYFAATTTSTLEMESTFSGELIYFVPVGNPPPTLNAINNLNITQGAPAQTVSLSDITSGSTTQNQTLTVTAVASDTNLISNLAVHYTSPNTNSTLTFTPAANANGTAIITITINNGQAVNNTIVRTFTVTVAPGSSQYLIINPLTNQLAVAGQMVTFATVTNRGGTVTYQWKFNGVNLAAATNPALTLSHVTTNQAGIYSVTATVTSLSGGRSLTCQAATLTVFPTAAANLAPASHVAGQYAFVVAGATGLKFVIQASTNLVNWVPLQTNTAPFTFVDTNAGSFRQRFYRSVYTP